MSQALPPVDSPARLALVRTIDHLREERATAFDFLSLDLDAPDAMSTQELFIRSANHTDHFALGLLPSEVLSGLLPGVDLHAESDASHECWNRPQEELNRIQQSVHQETGGRLSLRVPQLARLSPLSLCDPKWLTWKVPLDGAELDPNCVVGHDKDGQAIGLLELTYFRGGDDRTYWHAEFFDWFKGSTPDLEGLVDRLESSLTFADAASDEDCTIDGPSETITMDMLGHLMTVSVLADRPNPALWERIFGCLAQDPDQPQQDLICAFAEFNQHQTPDAQEMKIFETLASHSAIACQQLLALGSASCHPRLAQLALRLGAQPSCPLEGQTPLEVVGSISREDVDAVEYARAAAQITSLLHAALAHEHAMEALQSMSKAEFSVSKGVQP